MYGKILFVATTLAITATYARAAATYPVAELGNCSSQESCANYCDLSENQLACTAYADRNNLDATGPTPVVSTVTPGPGGCISEADCASYCDLRENQTECSAFSNTTTTIDVPVTPLPGGSTVTSGTSSTGTTNSGNTASTTATLSAEDQKQADTIAKFGGPDGACNDLVSCRIYCDDPAHELSCTQYSLAHDLLPRAQAETTITVLTTTGPQGCTGDACDEYCALPGHETECIEYAKKKGLIDPKDADKQLKLIDAATTPTRMTTKPGRCDGAACSSYCSDPGNKAECLQYALENGITPNTIGDYGKAVAAPASSATPPSESPANEVVPVVPVSSPEGTSPQGASLGDILTKLTNRFFSK